jgi:geranylgeranyl diphosphate synthase type II
MTPNVESAVDLTTLRQRIDEKLEALCAVDGNVPEVLASAMRYSVMAGGKRLRPILCWAAHRACGGVECDNLWRTAAAIEFLHTFSLIHDDLPCMDDDDMRRGQPTCHKKFGEGVAVLGGDALAVRAFELLAQTQHSELVVELAKAIGPAGMIGGQIADLDAEGLDVTLEEVKSIHSRKTAALFRASAVAGGLLAGGSADDIRALGIYGEHLGVAFQIVDDLLDMEGDPRVMGKSTGADVRLKKATYPGVSSVLQARDDARRAADSARAAITRFEARQALEALVELAVRREA